MIRKFLSFAMLAALALSLNSCMKNEDFGGGGTEYDNGVKMFLQVNNQRTVTLDPFEVAQRLNIYLNENKSDEVRNALFGTGVTISEVSATEYSVLYESTNMSVAKDLIRVGEIRFKTNGKLLSEPGAKWNVYTPVEEMTMNSFRVSVLSGIWNGVTIAEGTYIIENITAAGGKSEWMVSANDFVTAPLPYNKPLVSKWNNNVKLVKEEPGFDLASYKNCTFTMNYIGSPDMNGGVTFYNTLYSCQQDGTFTYKSSCATNMRKILTGKEKITLNLGIAPNVQTEVADVAYGEVANCDNRTKITYKGQTREITY